MINKLVWLVLFISFFNHADAQPQLRWCLGTFPGFYGFNAVTKQPEGPSVLYLQELAKRANFTLIPSQETPSSRCLAQMASGESDLMINLLKTGSGRHSIEYIQFAERWPDHLYFSGNTALRLDTPSQLSTLTLVTIRNYKVAPEIQTVLDGMKKGQLIQVDSVLTALQMAAKQRIDAALLPPTQVKSLLLDQPELAAQLKSIEFSAELVKPQAVYMGISKRCNCQELVTAIQQQIKTMQQDGSAQKIFADKLIAEF